MAEGLGDSTEKPPILLVLNKRDLIKPGEIAKKLEVRTCRLIFVLKLKCLGIYDSKISNFRKFFTINAFQWYEKFTNVDEVIPVSAKYGHGVEDIKNWILSKLPVGPAFYPKVLRL